LSFSLISAARRSCWGVRSASMDQAAPSETMPTSFGLSAAWKIGAPLKLTQAGAIFLQFARL